MPLSETEKLQAIAEVIGTAATLIRFDVDAIEKILRTPATDDLRAARTMMDPLLRAALTFVKAYDDRVLTGKDALGKVHSKMIPVVRYTDGG